MNNENSSNYREFRWKYLNFMNYKLPIQYQSSKTNDIEQSDDKRQPSSQSLNHANTVSHKENLNNHDESEPCKNYQSKDNTNQ
jgi:hypothetical protein